MTNKVLYTDDKETKERITRAQNTTACNVALSVGIVAIIVICSVLASLILA